MKLCKLYVIIVNNSLWVEQYNYCKHWKAQKKKRLKNDTFKKLYKKKLFFY